MLLTESERKKELKKQAIVSEFNLHNKQYIESNNVHFFACNSFIGLNYKWNEKYYPLANLFKLVVKFNLTIPLVRPLNILDYLILRFNACLLKLLFPFQRPWTKYLTTVRKQWWCAGRKCNWLIAKIKLNKFGLCHNTIIFTPHTKSRFRQSVNNQQYVIWCNLKPNFIDTI